MRCGNRTQVALLVMISVCAQLSAAQSQSPIHQQRYSMGTIVDIVAYHPARAEAEAAIRKALDEFVRLDQVMSHYEADGDVSRLMREGRKAAVAVDPSLFEVIRESNDVSRRSGGKFDITVGPLVKLWREAQAEERTPTAAEIANARRCVGYKKIELIVPDRIRLRADCIQIDLGGIGKGYAVDRAIDVLKSSGIKHAVVNAGTSSIASIGSPPDGKGWPVEFLSNRSGNKSILLRNASVSTSQQTGGILDPATGAPTTDKMTVTVVAPRATISDALSTTLLLMAKEDGMKLLEQFSDVSAFWISPAGQVIGSYRESQVELTHGR